MSRGNVVKVAGGDSPPSRGVMVENDQLTALEPPVTLSEGGKRAGCDAELHPVRRVPPLAIAIADVEQHICPQGRSAALIVRIERERGRQVAT